MSYRRTNDGDPLEVEPSTAGASGGRDLGEFWTSGPSLPELDAGETGERCIDCLRFTYEPGYGCIRCGKGLASDEVNREA